VTASLPSDTQRFSIRIGPRSRPLLLIFGVRAGNSYVDLTADSLDARFGFFNLRVAITNIGGWRIEGPWLWITAIGVRRGYHGDITFGGNQKGGVRIDFKSPERRSILRIPRVYVTVADLEGLGAALTAAGIPGEDARRSQ
jgi:hypothetical protein